MLNKRNLTATPGVASKLTKTSFFIDNNPLGVVNATPFMDYYEPMMQNLRLFKKHQNLWKLLKEGRTIVGFIDVVHDQKKATPYLWLEFELPRGKFNCRLNILSDQMVNFFERYQNAQASIDFSLDDLIEEAERIEGGQSDIKPIEKQKCGVGGTIADSVSKESDTTNNEQK